MADDRFKYLYKTQEEIDAALEIIRGIFRQAMLSGNFDFDKYYATCAARKSEETKVQ